MALSPLDAMEQSVRLAAGAVDYHRHRLAQAAIDGDVATIEALRGPYADAIRLQSVVGKAAIDAGVAERRQDLAEEFGAMLVAAGTDGLQAAASVLRVTLTAEALDAHRQAYTARLALIEGGDAR